MRGKMRAVIGIDVGTTHIKSILFDENGTVLAQEKRTTPLSKDENGSIYEPLEIWNVVEEQLKNLCRTGIAVSGISITGMAEAGLIVDRETKTEKTVILPWFDGRTRELADKMSPEKEEEIFASTGLRNSFKYGIYKFLWLLSACGADREGCIWLSMCDYIAWKLTGRFVTEPGFAARTYVYDIRQGKWDIERIREYGLEENNFPEVMPSGAVIGFWNTEDGRQIPVAIAGHDHICAAFGLLYHDRNGICDSAGTSETYVGLLEEGTDRFLMETGMLYGPFVDGGYFYMANLPSSGHSVEWFRTKLQTMELSYEEMNMRLEGSGKEPTGILYFPYLTGMGSPLYEASMRGSILGIGENTDGMTLLKGVMEGIQYQSAWLLDILHKKHGAAGKAVFCAGGAVNNHVMMQLKADILNRTVVVPEMPEATLFGAAALFVKKNLGERAALRFVQKLQEQKKIYTPDEERTGKYHEIWKKRYLPMIDILKQFYCDGGN